MKPYEYVDVSEAKLEDLIRQSPELIEDGLRFVDHQRRTTDGRIDVLLVDSGGAIVVAELKILEDDGMLIQALDYFDYVSTNREALARVYAASKIDPTQPARLLLIAPSFSTALVNRTKWFNLTISLFAYRCIKVSGADADATLPVFVEIKPAPVVETVATRSLDDALNYITDERVRAKAINFLDVLRAFGPRIALDPVQGAVSVKRDGRVFAYLWPRRKWFIFGHRDVEGEWVTTNVELETDPTPIRDSLQASFKKGA